MMRRLFERFLNKKEVEIIKSSPIVEVGATDITLKDGSKIPTHTLIWTAVCKVIATRKSSIWKQVVRIV